MPFNHDTERLDWLELQQVEVRGPARYGSLLIFQTQGTQHDAELDYDSDLRAKIDIQIQIAKGAPRPIKPIKDYRPRICRAPPYDGDGWICYGGRWAGGGVLEIPVAFGHTPERAYLLWRTFATPSFSRLPFVPRKGSELNSWLDGQRRIYQQTGLLCRSEP
jgi:hypothetical protein